MCARISTQCGGQHRHWTLLQEEVNAKQTRILRHWPRNPLGPNYSSSHFPHPHTCSKGGHTWSSPMERQEVLSQRFHTNSQLGSVTGLSLGKGRVRSSVSQKKCAPVIQRRQAMVGSRIRCCHCLCCCCCCCSACSFRASPPHNHRPASLMSWSILLACSSRTLLTTTTTTSLLPVLVPLTSVRSTEASSLTIYRELNEVVYVPGLLLLQVVLQTRSWGTRVLQEERRSREATIVMRRSSTHTATC